MTLSTREQLLEKLKQAVSMRGVKFLIAIPTYNEVGNIRELIEGIIANVDIEKEILVIDDGSPDGTADVVSEMKESINGLNVYRRSGKMGLGSAYLEAFALAIEAGFPFVITMDADLSHNPVVINQMIAKISENDLVIGSRYTDGGSIPNFELWRRWMSKGGNWLAKTLLKVKAKDCTSGFRCYRTEVLKNLKVNQNVESKQYIFLVEILLWLTINHCRIGEVPIIFNQRTRGKTKVSPTEFLHALERIVQLSFRTNVLHRKVVK